MLGNLPGTKVYESIDACDQVIEFIPLIYKVLLKMLKIQTIKKAKEFETIKIIRYEESIYYANVDNFKYKIVKLSGVNPTEILASVKKQKDIQLKLAKKANQAGIEQVESQTNQNDILNNLKLKNVIIDFSCVNYVDSQGVNAILQLHEIYQEIGVKIHLTYCKREFFDLILI